MYLVRSGLNGVVVGGGIVFWAGQDSAGSYYKEAGWGWEDLGGGWVVIFMGSLFFYVCC